MIGANDGGVDITVNGGESWYAPPLPIGQFYHVSVDNRVPYRVAGAMQDIGTAQGPSNTPVGRRHPQLRLAPRRRRRGRLRGLRPGRPDIVYAGEYGGYLSRYDHRTRQERNVTACPFNPSGHGPAPRCATASSGPPRSPSRRTTRSRLPRRQRALPHAPTAAQTWNVDQPRPDAQRRSEAAVVRRPDHRRQHRRRDLLHDLRVAESPVAKGRDLGRQRRRPGARHARRRQDAGRT